MGKIIGECENTGYSSVRHYRFNLKGELYELGS